jgi:thioredoxin 1
MASTIKELDDSTLEKEMAATGKLVVVEFYTDTCPNCKAMEPVFRQLSDELAKDAVFAKVNAQHSLKSARKHGVFGVPTFKFFCGGQPIGELVGAINATMLRNTVKDLIRHRNECIEKSTRISWDMDGYG